VDPVRLDGLLGELMRGVNAMMLSALGDKVVEGPFRGMKIAKPEEQEWDDGNFSCKLLGGYEFELHEALAFAISREPKQVINVGCADGYYAVGLAKVMPDAVVSACDVSAKSLDVTKKYAMENGVFVSTWQGCETPEELRVGPRPGPGPRLYLVDCEGAELRLLDPTAVPELLQSDIIVECHDFMDPKTSLKVVERFQKTHGPEIIRPRLPLYSRYEFLNKTPGVMQVLAVTEKRPMPTMWLALWAHDRGD
jgi:hypothetical protein